MTFMRDVQADSIIRRQSYPTACRGCVVCLFSNGGIKKGRQIHVVGGGTIKPELSKVEAVQVPVPQTKKRVRAFLGLTGV